MTEHPISLPPKLWDKWIEDGCDGFLAACEAARWGADQELDACIDVILAHPGLEHPELLVEVLRAARRPKPPSLKQQALEALKHAPGPDYPSHITLLTADEHALIRSALEALPDG